MKITNSNFDALKAPALLNIENVIKITAIPLKHKGKFVLQTERWSYFRTWSNRCSIFQLSKTALPLK